MHPHPSIFSSSIIILTVFTATIVFVLHKQPTQPNFRQQARSKFTFLRGSTNLFFGPERN